MIRFVVVVTAFVCLPPVAAAAVASTKTQPPRAEGQAKAQKGTALGLSRKHTAAVPANADFEMTPTSEVKLNGRACRFKDVPDSAVVTRIEVDAVTKAVLIIHFSTGK